MKKFISYFIVFVFIISTLPICMVHADSEIGTSYYIDSIGGDDCNVGTSEDAPWQTLEKINETIFEPGDKILLKADGIWTGQLHPQGSGTSNNPIIVDMYGSGSKPIINGDGVKGGTVYLFNQEYWEINNLEVTNNPSNSNGLTKQGILIFNDCIGTLNHIYVSNCYVHDVQNILGSGEGKDNKEGAGIMYKITYKEGEPKSKWNDIKIDNNVIKNIEREGILLQSSFVNKPENPNSVWDGCGPYYPSTDLEITNNSLENIAGDGIIPWSFDGGVIEYNTCKKANNTDLEDYHAGIWPYFCENLIFQYNECYETQRRLDGMAFNFDNSCNNCIYQYNYSHDNEGGFLSCCSGGDSYGNICRYNVSENDGCHPFSRVFNINSAGNHDFYVYNNTIYVDKGNPIMMTNLGKEGNSIHFFNNIFINNGLGVYGTTQGTTFDNNLYCGNYYVLSDKNRIVSNPQLKKPNSGGIGLDSVDGYKLKANSPCIDMGREIPGDNGGKDYWGNPLYYGHPDIGAFEFQDNLPENLVINSKFETGESSPWTTYKSGITDNYQYEGNYCGYVEHNGSLEQTIYDLEPNTTYTLSGWIKVENEGDDLRLGVKEYGSTAVEAQTSSSTYKQKSIEFTTGQSNTSAIIYLWIPDSSKGSGDGFGDDIHLSVYNE